MSAGKQSGRLAEVLCGKSEPLEHCARFGFVFITACAPEVFFQRCVAFGIRTAPLGKPFRQFGEAKLGFVQMRKGTQRPVQHCLVSEIVFRLL